MKEEVINSTIREGLVFHATREEDDGGLTLVFDIDDSFKKKFAAEQGMRRWSAKKFEKWINNALHEGLKLMEKEYENRTR